jgi:hypothetical protein
LRPPPLSRRALLRGGAIGLAAATAAGCGSGGDRPPAASAPPDPETLLLRELIAEKERMVALYRAAVSTGPRAERLRAFLEHHEAHLAELRRRSSDPVREPLAAGTPTPSGATVMATPSPTPAASAGAPTLRALREAERDAAATRPGQLDAASPALAQLIASIGACEAAHALALSRSR